MPTYLLRCTTCKHEDEVFCSHKTATETKCAKCGDVTNIVIQPAAYSYHGTDYMNPVHRIKKHVISKSVGRYDPKSGKVVDDGGE